MNPQKIINSLSDAKPKYAKVEFIIPGAYMLSVLPRRAMNGPITRTLITSIQLIKNTKNCRKRSFLL